MLPRLGKAPLPPRVSGGEISLRHTGTSVTPLPDPDPKAPDTGTKLGPPEGGGIKSLSWLILVKAIQRNFAAEAYAPLISALGKSNRTGSLSSDPPPQYRRQEKATGRAHYLPIPADLLSASSSMPQKESFARE